MNLNTIDNKIDIRDRDNNWWGKLPIGWRVKKLKYISLIQLSNVDKLSVDGQEIVFLCNYTDVYKNEKIVSTLPFMQATATDEQIKRLSIQKSDVLLTKDSETPDDIGIPAIVAEEITGVVCGYHLALSRPNPDMVHSGFLFRAIQSQPIKRYFYVNSVGMTRYGLDKQAIAEIPIPLPSLSIQKAIAEYLDREIAHIDALIDAKKSLIELLAEKRQALIEHAVTHGLNSKATFRNTGVAWLGDIPTHWQDAPLKRLVKTKITDGPHETPDYDPEGTPFVSAEAVQNGRINFESRWGNIPHRLHKKYAEKLLPRRHDIFMVKSGATTGKLAYVDVDIEFNVWSPLALIRAEETKILPKFLFIVLHADYIQRQIRATWSAGTQPNISMGAIEELNIITPPLDEQQEIVDYLDREINKIDRLSQATQSSIALLSERRDALISAAVSGQLGYLYEETK